MASNREDHQTDIAMNKVSEKKVKSFENRKGGWRSAIFIIFVEMAERFSYYGVAGNLITYFTTVLGQPTATAAKNVNTFQGVSALFPLLGGFFADSYFGRFKAIVVSTLVYILGLILLAVASIPALRHRGWLFFAALYILSVGEGGHKPCVQTFAADQFDDDSPAAKSSFFNWWYLGIVVGATLAILGVIYVEDYVGWTVGFAILTSATVVALAVFLAGARTYCREVPAGSPFTRVAQVAVAAFRKRRVSSHGGAWYGNNGQMVNGFGHEIHVARSLAPTKQFRFLDKATIIDETDLSTEKPNPWRLCSVHQVEETKLLLRLLPIWLTCLAYAAVIAQQGTFFTKQGFTMIRAIGSFRFPPASFQVVTSLTILTSVTLYDRVFVPVARKFTGIPSGITVLQRIGAGLFCSAVAMVVAGLVETKRIRIAEEFGLLDSPKSTLPISIWWLAPQYVLIGLGDVLAIVGLQEVFYEQMPAEMRSVGAGLYISVVGVGNFLSGLLITVVQAVTDDTWLVNNINRAHLNRFYYLLACIAALNLCVYVFAAKAFVYKKMEEQQVAADV